MDRYEYVCVGGWVGGRGGYVRACVRACVYSHAHTLAPPRTPAPSPVTPVGVCLSFVSPVPSCPLLL